MNQEEDRLSARVDDPDTSQQAAAEIQEAIPYLQTLILRKLRDNARGLTTRQLSYATGIDFATITPRMRPMADKGWVEMTTVKVKNPHGKGWGRVWIILPAGQGVIA